MIPPSQKSEAESGCEAFKDYLGEEESVRDKHRERMGEIVPHFSELELFLLLKYDRHAMNMQNHQGPSAVVILLQAFSKALQTFLIWGAAWNFKYRELKEKSTLKYCNRHEKIFIYMKFLYMLNSFLLPSFLYQVSPFEFMIWHVNNQHPIQSH